MTHAAHPPSLPLHHNISRRHVFRLGVLAAARCVPCPALALGRTTPQCERSLDVSNVPTGEHLTTVYWIQGEYVPEALQDMSYVLRDHHSDHVKPIDPQLLDLLEAIRKLIPNKSTSYKSLKAWKEAAYPASSFLALLCI